MVKRRERFLGVETRVNEVARFYVLQQLKDIGDLDGKLTLIEPKGRLIEVDLDGEDVMVYVSLEERANGMCQAKMTPSFSYEYPLEDVYAHTIIAQVRKEYLEADVRQELTQFRNRLQY